MIFHDSVAPLFLSTFVDSLLAFVARQFRRSLLDGSPGEAPAPAFP